MTPKRPAYLCMHPTHFVLLFVISLMPSKKASNDSSNETGKTIFSESHILS